MRQDSRRRGKNCLALAASATVNSDKSLIDLSVNCLAQRLHVGAQMEVEVQRGVGTRGCDMTAFCPEFSAFWLAVPRPDGERRSSDSAAADQALSPAQQVALEELVERINAARSVI
jgi:hypothetical protein